MTSIQCLPVPPPSAAQPCLAEEEEGEDRSPQPPSSSLTPSFCNLVPKQDVRFCNAPRGGDHSLQVLTHGTPSWSATLMTSLAFGPHRWQANASFITLSRGPCSVSSWSRALPTWLCPQGPVSLCPFAQDGLALHWTAVCRQLPHDLGAARPLLTKARQKPFRLPVQSAWL